MMLGGESVNDRNTPPYDRDQEGDGDNDMGLVGPRDLLVLDKLRDSEI
jgi:hypothetical protein